MIKVNCYEGDVVNDTITDFLKILEKMLKCPFLTLSDSEIELVKEFLAQVLENNPNYGHNTKQVFKIMLDEANDPIKLALQLQTYIVTHDVSK